jgi:hypothetical protein
MSCTVSTEVTYDTNIEIIDTPSVAAGPPMERKTRGSDSESSVRQCNGLTYEMPDEKDAYSAYPFGLHTKNLPWDVQVLNCGRTIHFRSHGCKGQRKDGEEECENCGNLMDRGYLPGILT